MNNYTPLISVIIPVYNRVQFIAEAIDSVLNQDYPAIELIIVDGHSTDGSSDIIAEAGCCRCVSANLAQLFQISPI